METPGKHETELLRLLQKNSRFDINDLTEHLGISKTSVYEKIKKLEKEGYIKDYVALLDAKKVGLNFTVIVTIALTSQRIEYVEEFSRHIAALDEVVEAYETGGIFDFIIKVVVKDPETFTNFISNKLSVIPHIRQIRSSFVMSQIKESTALHF